MEKTVVIKIVRRVQHPLYGKTVLKTMKFKAHDEVGCDIGDTVEIMETRPISKDKTWRVTRILEKVKNNAPKSLAESSQHSARKHFLKLMTL